MKQIVMTFMIGIMGNPFYAKKLENLLKILSVPVKLISITHRDSNFKNEIHDVQIIHFVYSPTLTLGGLVQILRLKLIWKKKILVTWIGTDVFLATTTFKAKLYTFLSKIFIYKHITVAENLTNELKSLGINANTQAFPFFDLYAYSEPPKEKKIGIYLPDNKKERFDFFQGNLIKKLVNEFPDISFIIFPNTGKYFSENNVTCVEWINSLEQTYREVQAIIRLPIHDGLSNTIIEALSTGRSVISTQTVIPYCKIIKNYDDLKKFTSQVILNSDELNKEISKKIHIIFDKDKLLSDLTSLYKKI